MNHREMQGIYTKNEKLFSQYEIPEFVLNEQDAKRLWDLYNHEKDNQTVVWEEAIQPFKRTYWKYLIQQIIIFESTQTLKTIFKTYPHITSFKISYDSEYEGWAADANFFEKHDFCITEHLSTELRSQLKNRISGRLWSHAVHESAAYLFPQTLWPAQEGIQALLLAAYGERGARYFQETQLNKAAEPQVSKLAKPDKI